MKAKWAWCTLKGHFLKLIDGWKVRKRLIKPPKKARCPDCGKQFKVERRMDSNGEIYKYFVPPHKKRVK